MTEATKKKMSAARKKTWAKLHKIMEREGCTLEDARKILNGGENKPKVNWDALASEGYQLPIHSQLLQAGFSLLRLVEFDKDKAYSVIGAAKDLHEVVSPTPVSEDDE